MTGHIGVMEGCREGHSGAGRRQESLPLLVQGSLLSTASLQSALGSCVLFISAEQIMFGRL